MKVTAVLVSLARAPRARGARHANESGSAALEAHLLHLAGILDHRARPLGIAYEHTSVVPARDFCAHRYEFATWLSPAT